LIFLSNSENGLPERFYSFSGGLKQRRSWKKMATRKSSLIREIQALEKTLGSPRKAQMYQDDEEVEEVMQEIDDYLDDEVELDELDDLDDEVEIDEFDDLDDEVEIDEFDDEVELYQDDEDEFEQDDEDEVSQDVEELLQALEDDEVVMASEMDPGIEDEINQDYLDDVVELRDKEGLATEDSMLDTAPTEYKAAMKTASSRLDRVATYFEKTGRSKLAYRIDRISDAIDAQL